jgi:hypothetical protein
VTDSLAGASTASEPLSITVTGVTAAAPTPTPVTTSVPVTG